jgi:hypothetical protein
VAGVAGRVETTGRVGHQGAEQAGPVRRSRAGFGEQLEGPAGRGVGEQAADEHLAPRPMIDANGVGWRELRGLPSGDHHLWGMAQPALA